jgi:hypothetical protein
MLKKSLLLSALTGLACCFWVPIQVQAAPIGASKSIGEAPSVGLVVRFARGGMGRRTTVVGPRGGVARSTTVRRGAVGRGAVVRPGFRGGGVRWVRPGGYWWRPGGAIAAGAAIGFVSAATAAAWAGAAPGPNMCWYYTDPSQRAGFWDACH